MKELVSSMAHTFITIPIRFMLINMLTETLAEVGNSFPSPFLGCNLCCIILIVVNLVVSRLYPSWEGERTNPWIVQQRNSNLFLQVKIWTNTAKHFKSRFKMTP